MFQMEELINKVHCSECIEFMEKIPDSSIHMIITSPPYNAGKDYKIWNDKLPYDEYFDFVRKWIKESYRILTEDGRIAINIPLTANNPALLKRCGLLVFLPQYYQILQEAGFTIREIIVWIKSNEFNDASKFEMNFCGSNTAWGSWLSASAPYLRSFSEFIIVASKGDWKLKRDGKSDISKEDFMRFTRNVWSFSSSMNKNHPAVFPEELPYRLIKLFTYVNDIILDPFSGTGTTSIVAKKLKRRYIGIELNPEYVSLSQKELEKKAEPLL